MAVREIKTTIALDGEQKFKQAIAGATREMRVMESELKAVTAAYDVNGDSAAYYVQKQQNLKNQISQQQSIVKSLERAVEDASKAYGRGSKQADDYAIKLNNARVKMSRLEKQLEDTDREMEELGRDSAKVGRQIDTGIGDGAEDANRDLQDLYNTISKDLGSIKASTAITAVKNLWDTATGAFSAVDGFVDGTREYRRQMSFLEQNAATAGFDFEWVKEQLMEVSSLTGDINGAIEGVSNLLATDMDATQISSAIALLSGAVIQFPDTLKFESLADSLQETLATGSATGQFAELLERMGVDVEEFNEALENSPTAAGDAEIALAYLAAAGLGDVKNAYAAANEAMIEAEKTNQELEAELAEFGATLEQYITTPVKEKFVEAMQWVNDKVKEIEESGGEVTAGAVIGMGVGTVAKGIGETAKAVAVGIAEDAKYVASSIVTLGREQARGAVENITETMHGWGSTTADREVAELVSLVERASAEKNMSSYYNGTNITSADGAAILPIGTAQTAAERVAELFGAIQTKTEEKTPELESAWEETGEAAMDAFSAATRPGMEDASGGAYDAGLSMATAFGSGLLSRATYVRSAGSALAAAASAGMQGASYVPSGPVNKQLIATLNIDGREFARATAEYLDAQLTNNGR